jgi:hypothetical protein
MYFPSSQIKNNLHTNGGEYILSTTKENYIGYYYSLATGKKYTGKSPNDKPNILLEEENINEPSKQGYLDPGNEQNITIIGEYPISSKSIERLIPLYNSTIPIQKDYDLGVFQRYFCKKNNELIYIEIDKTTFQQLNSKFPQIAWDLYSAISLNWYLTGDKSKVYNTNKNLSTLVETQEKWHGFTQYFKDKYLKYYLES